MLTDTKLRNLKPRDKLYKVNDREGLYVAVTPAGSISFRYNYSINGRQETLTFGRYGVGGITLAEAREQLSDAKKMVAAGKSPAKEKARDKARVKDAETFGAWAEKWLRGYQMADSTRDMRRSVYERELKPKFSNQKLVEITHEDLRALTDAIVERGAPATAIHACIDPALSAQIRLLKHKPQRGSSCPAPDVDAGSCKSGSSRQSHGWRVAASRTGGGARIGL